MSHTIALDLNSGRRLLCGVAELAAIAGLVAIGILHAPPSQAQSQAVAPLTFEVASVKRSQPGGQTDGGRYRPWQTHNYQREP
jgi:hypothetical protein